MGLDITAYAKIQRIEPQPTEDQDPEGATHLSINPEFHGRANGIAPGFYVYSAIYPFRAGSYSGYSLWRDELAKLAGYPPVLHEEHHKYAASAWNALGGPFWELINFSDCEGTIGAEISAKLANDFAEFQAKADAHPEEWFRKKYNDWKLAFELASDAGAVSFH